MKIEKQKSYGGFRRSGMRLTEEPIKGFTQHSSEKERPVLYAIHAFDKAHLVMLAEEKLIPARDVALMLKELRAMEKKGVEETRVQIGGGFHSGEKYLIDSLGEQVGGRIHLGRSSGDVGVVARRIYQRDRLLVLLEEINRLRETLLAQADKYRSTVMPGYTFGQHAQPVTLGHTYAAWATMLERDFERIFQAYRRINTSPAGAAIMTGSEFPLNRERVAGLLGFDAVRLNTQDAILPHDDLFDSLTSLTLLTDNLARWASDLELWTTSEFNFVELPDRFCGTSSIMPQKKNPNVLQVIRGAAADTLGALVTAIHGIKGPSGFPILERHYIEPELQRIFDNAAQHLQWMVQLIPALEINEERMRAQAGAYWTQATDIAGAMVREKALPWRSAHQITSIIVRLAQERGLTPADIDTSLVDEAGHSYNGEPVGLSEQALQEALDPTLCVQRRTLPGGPAPTEVQRQIGVLGQTVAQDSRTVQALLSHIENSASQLERAIDNVIHNTFSEVEETEDTHN